MKYNLENQYIQITADSFGATLTSIQSKTDRFQYLWQGNPEIWNGQSPILFPIIGRLLDDKFRYKDKEFEVVRHGFARRRPFDLVKQTDSQLVFLQTENNETLRSFPFRYQLYISFSIEESRLTVTHTVVNPNSLDMFFSLGAHPAFNCSIGDALVFEKSERLISERIDSDSLLTDNQDFISDGTELLLTDHLFDKDALIFSRLNSKSVCLKRADGAHNLTFFFGDAPFFAVWSKPNAPFVCLEPWYGINDSYEKKSDIAQKRGIVQLPGKEKFEFSWCAELTIK